MHLSRQPLVLAVAITCALVAARPAAAGAPTDGLMSNIDRVIKALEDPTLKRQPEARRAAVRKIAGEIFDVGETARRSLATGRR